MYLTIFYIRKCQKRCFRNVFGGKVTRNSVSDRFFPKNRLETVFLPAFPIKSNKKQCFCRLFVRKQARDTVSNSFLPAARLETVFPGESLKFPLKRQCRLITNAPVRQRSGDIPASDGDRTGFQLVGMPQTEHGKTGQH